MRILLALEHPVLRDSVSTNRFAESVNDLRFHGVTTVEEDLRLFRFCWVAIELRRHGLIHEELIQGAMSICSRNDGSVGTSNTKSTEDFPLLCCKESTIDHSDSVRPFEPRLCKMAVSYETDVIDNFLRRQSVKPFRVVSEKLCCVFRKSIRFHPGIG